jgi:hypothetical protein
VRWDELDVDALFFAVASKAGHGVDIRVDAGPAKCCDGTPVIDRTDDGCHIGRRQSRIEQCHGRLDAMTAQEIHAFCLRAAQDDVGVRQCHDGVP